MLSAEARLAEAPWSRPAIEVVEALGADPERGLTQEEARTRLRRFGANRLREPERQSVWATLLHQLANLVVALLLLAAVVAFTFGEMVEGLSILVVLGVNTALGFLSEHRAVRSMEALRQLIRIDATVRRDGALQLIPAESVVPGDIVIIASGDVISADLRLTKASTLQTDESALTGESMPVDKSIEPLGADAALADRAGMLYSGTAVTRGNGEGVVVATGLDTELGRISTLVQSVEPAETPLRRHLDALGRRLVWATLAIAALVGVAAFWSGKPLFMLIETSLALAVAAVPEGLPIVVTMAQARGMWRMARRNALIERLSAVETLGSTSVILTDKTGTLTENRMTVTRIAVDSGEFRVEAGDLQLVGGSSREEQPPQPKDDALLVLALRIGALCSNAAVAIAEKSRTPDVVGDPMEVALVLAARKADLSRGDLLRHSPELREVAFDPELKLMATYHQDGDEVFVAAKGAPETLLEASSMIATTAGPQRLTGAARQHWLKVNDAMARDGLRVLGVAMKHVEAVSAEPYTELMFVGLMGLMDPPRGDVAPALKACRGAGIRVVMVTGDQAPTARNVARAIGLAANGTEVLNGPDLPPFREMQGAVRERVLNASIVARTTPEQKLDLIGLHQATGATVAMTGDGVNDAPALKKADIGIAMGLHGTQVAQEAAAMVLKDDAFATIVVAVEQGRVIFANIRKVVLYLLSCNASEILVVGLATLAHAPLPILPLQILFLNLVTDVFPALALGVGEGSRELMREPPRDPREPILIRGHWWTIGGYGLLITFVTLLALALALRVVGLDAHHAVTISFLTLAFAQLWHVFNMRERGGRLLLNEVTRNPWVWGALALCVGLLVAAVYVPGLDDALGLIRPSGGEWGLILGLSSIPVLIGQLFNTARN